jgi:protein-L-isoaspartate(D-aspartate) O-methyltransferase
MSLQTEKTNMITQQLRAGDILNKQILSLYDEISRDEFVPNQFRPFAYSDLQIELPHNQRMMTPLEEATLLQALKLSGTETVLEVGTGSGFLTALLSRLAKKVISIDYFADFTTAAKEPLSHHECNNVELVTGDAFNGWVDKAPYDVIIFSGTLETLAETHRLQTLPGGKIVAFIGKQSAIQAQLHHLDHQGHWSVEVLYETSLPPLIDLFKPNDFVF